VCVCVYTHTHVPVYWNLIYISYTSDQAVTTLLLKGTQSSYCISLKHMPYRKTFEMRVRNLNAIYILCHVPIFRTETAYDRNSISKYNGSSACVC